MTDATTLSGDELAELLGAHAADWPGLGLTVTRGTPIDPETADEVTVHHGDTIIGFTEPSTRFAGHRVYRALITTDHPGVPFPAGFIPPNPLRAQHDERLHWLPEGHLDRPAHSAVRSPSTSATHER